jgi:hypothetical protein
MRASSGIAFGCLLSLMYPSQHILCNWVTNQQTLGRLTGKTSAAEKDTEKRETAIGLDTQECVIWVCQQGPVLCRLRQGGQIGNNREHQAVWVCHGGNLGCSGLR